jgi:glycosyltransferase involved in cell wall biosynthesis
VREFSYIPWLTAHGLSVDIQSLLPDSYVQRLYGGGGRRAFDLLRSYTKRLGYLLTHRRPGVIWLEKELWPYAPAGLEAALLSSVPYVLDVDDAVFHTYDEHRSAHVKRFLGQKIDRLFRGAALVTAGNAYLAQRALRAGAPWVETVPSVIDLNDYAADPGSASARDFTVGWVGSPATQRHVQAMSDILAELLNGAGGRFITIGTRFESRLFNHHEEQPWRRATEARQLRQFDVGIMPLPDEPFERGKCGYKLIQYMAAGVAVVASPVGVNKEIVRHGENGFLAQTAAEWRNALALLKQDPQLRRRMGVAGRAAVQRQYCLQVTGPKVADWLGRIATGHSAARVVH